MIGKISIVKNSKNFLNTTKKTHLKIPFRYREIVKQNKNISLSYDANDHARSNFVLDQRSKPKSS